jgi:hypothetical protein
VSSAGSPDGRAAAAWRQARLAVLQPGCRLRCWHNGDRITWTHRSLALPQIADVGLVEIDVDEIPRSPVLLQQVAAQCWCSPTSAWRISPTVAPSSSSRS